MNKYIYTVEFETDSASVLLVLKLMEPMIKGTLEEVRAVNVKQTFAIVENK